ncbi:glycosyltransferase family 1 protein [Pseudorhodoplanes sp.]|jgi:glycosyltransferase involved in cell wall biosynthesis|uniref:glycosyltransferase family 4 protein n=1 Tax=Pseudorhodoplanes sp. TaxID=1934341 RepID=UPI002B73ED74|nr:glycosyltransferase family 1 protein [Pseudorhodoplanes sp.]HWV40057.1 glycosyltransferase family 1 protein [Pseudorhodoplanes sp.]
MSGTILVNHLLEPPNMISGISRYLFALLEELAKSQRYRYVLATTWSAEQLPPALRALPVEIRTLPFQPKTPVNVVNQLATVSRLMRETGAILEFNCNPVGCFLGGWPRVITVHDIYMDTMPLSYPWRHRMWWKLLFPLALRGASAVVCVSQSTRREVAQRYAFAKDKLVVVHEAPILAGDAGDAGACDAGFETPYGLYVGNVSPNKNVAVLVEALKLLKAEGDAPIIYHVGRDSAGLLAEAERRHASEGLIRKAGVLSDRALAAAYRGATCFINTSLNEGFCLPVVEAQSLGAPVICADIPVLREVAGEGALFFPPDDPAALARQIKAMFADQALQQRMAQASRDNVARFSWQRAARETEDVFGAVLASRTRPQPLRQCEEVGALSDR